MWIKNVEKMKRVFICSRYAESAVSTIAENIAKAKKLCKLALDRGHAPFAPHLFYPNILNDTDPDERAKGLACGAKFLLVCDEVWVEKNIEASRGMLAELNLAERLNIPVFVQDITEIEEKK